MHPPLTAAPPHRALSSPVPAPQRALPKALVLPARGAHILLSAYHLAYSAVVFIVITWDGSIAAWRADNPPHTQRAGAAAARGRAAEFAPAAAHPRAVPGRGRRSVGFIGHLSMVAIILLGVVVPAPRQKSSGADKEGRPAKKD